VSLLPQDHYPAVTITATDIKPVRPTHPEHGAFLKMNDGAVYICITAETAKQWIGVLETITNEGINE